MYLSKRVIFNLREISMKTLDKYKIVATIILFIVLFLNFKDGIFIRHMDFKNDYRIGGIYLVCGKIESKKHGINDKYGLGRGIRRIILTHDNHGNELTLYKAIPYKSQFGLQGHIFSSIFKNFDSEKYRSTMRCVCSFLSALVLLAISIFVCKKYDYIMGASFYFVFLLSPWVYAHAKHPYWVEFTWFLPVLSGLICSLYKNKIINIISILFVFLFILIKSLCGYEYISTVMMTTVSFLFFDLAHSIINKNKVEIVRNIKLILWVSLASIAGFLIALCIHGYIRGDGNIINGLTDIYRYDILRRTHGNPELFHPVYSKSLSVSAWVTVRRYFKFYTDVLFMMKPSLFFYLYSLPVLIFIWNAIIKKQYVLDFIMYIYFLLCTLSWFVLAKGHSYNHYHINYVLWYFGFVQICVYIISKNLYNYMIAISKNLYSLIVMAKSKMPKFLHRS